MKKQFQYSNKDFSNCRKDCAACCIYLSISSPLPGMTEGKPAGVRCIHLSDDLLCNIYNDPERPQVCTDFIFDPLICGNSAYEAKEIISSLEK
ncbi:MAG: YkgJ family cysteine cluster protein [Bacteroidota bacterium]